MSESENPFNAPTASPVIHPVTVSPPVPTVSEPCFTAEPKKPDIAWLPGTAYSPKIGLEHPENPPNVGPDARRRFSGARNEILPDLERQADEAQEAAVRAIGAYEDVLKSATEAIRRDFAIEARIKPLYHLPRTIANLREVEITLKTALDRAWDDLEVAEANVELAVFNEVNELGRPRYTNAEIRATEVTLHKRADPAYQAVLKTYRDAKQTAAEASLWVEQVLHEFEAAKLAAQLTAAQLAAISR